MLKQHDFDDEDICRACGVGRNDPDGSMPCDYPLPSAEDYFEPDDPRSIQP
jgi:hypothetical protein